MIYSIEQTDAALAGSQAAIRYRLSFRRAAQHIVDVVMEVDKPGATLELGLPVWVPGSYKVRDFIATLNDLHVADQQGRPLAWEWTSKNRLRLHTAGAHRAVISYNYYHGTERSVRTCHFDRTHGFINPANCLLFVRDRTHEIHHVAINHPWKKVSTALSPVRRGVWAALNYDILADSPIEIGDHFTADFTMHGARHQVAITGAGDFDPAWITAQCQRIVDTAVTKMWGSLPYDRYVFIIQLVPKMFGGLEHARSSVNMYDSEVFTDPVAVTRFLNLLVHEFFHAWNVKRIRPVELGPFDYDRENYTRMLWLAEGFTTYYDKLLTYRTGFVPCAEFLPYLTKNLLWRYFDAPGRLHMSVKDISFLAWVKFYLPTPDSDNRFPNYYIKGAVIAMMLDMEIIAATNGARSLDDVMLGLMGRYYQNPGKGLTEAEFMRVLRKATGTDLSAMLLEWLNGTDELPLNDTLAKVGLKWRRVPRAVNGSTFGKDLPAQDFPDERDTGLTLDDSSGRLLVAKVRRDSRAEHAGIAPGDELLALNGRRLAGKAQFEAGLRGVKTYRVELTACNNGLVYTTELDLHGKAAFELVESPKATEEQNALRAKWMER